MTKALLYQPPKRWQIWVAFGCSIAIHVAAIGAAQNRRNVPPTAGTEDPAVDIVFLPADQEQPQSSTIEPPAPPESPPVTKDDDAFPEEQATPPPVPRKITKVTPPIARPASPGPASVARMGAVKVLAISAPRPEYPYEARRQRTTGSGVAVITVNSSKGNVVSVLMSQSTGSPILDNATVSSLRRWRFKPGTPATVQVPITFTLTGAIY